MPDPTRPDSRDTLIARRTAQALVTALCAVAMLTVAFAAPAAQSAANAPAAVWKSPDGEPLPFQSDAEIIDFMRTADIESVNDINLGVTKPRQVVLLKDGIRMRAALRDYDETFTERRFAGDFYARLRDSFMFDLPAYELSRILGLNNIPPVTLRRIGGAQVTLQVWIEDGLMETDRIANEITPPSALRFRQQDQDMRVFDSVIGNVDRNSGNIIMDENWNFWLIDHSRTFMRNDQTRYLERVTACSRELYTRLKELTLEDLMPRMSAPLTRSEVDWVLRRRDQVIAHIDALIVERGEGAVLFERMR